MREGRYLTGVVDFQELRRTMPPAVTVEGFPPLPGEGCGPYIDRVERALLLLSIRRGLR